MLCSSVIGMVEAKIIRDHIKQRDAAEKSGQLLVDAPTTAKTPVVRGGDRRFASPTARGGVSAKPQPGGWFATLLARAQAAVEEAQRTQQRQKKKGT